MTLHTRLAGLTLLLLGVAGGCSSSSQAGRITYNFVEYNRGASFPGRSDVVITSGSSDVRFSEVRLDGNSFFPDGSIVPHAFLGPLAHFDVPGAVNAFTEPYYGIRIFHFFKSRPRWGIGLDFTHLKAFIADPRQRVDVSGSLPDGPSGGTVVLGDYFAVLNVSHGVNHVAIDGTYRWMLFQSGRFPDGRLQPYVSAGGGPAIPHLELTLKRGEQLQPKAYSYQLRFGNWGLGAGAGLRWKITQHFGAYTEYKWSYSILGNMRFDNGEDVRVTMRFPSQHLIWGIYLGL